MNKSMKVGQLWLYIYIRIKKWELEGNTRQQPRGGLTKNIKSMADTRKKKSDFSADFSVKNRFSSGMEMILTKKKIGRKKIGKKSGKIPDFSAKNRKYPIFSRKNPIFFEKIRIFQKF